MAMYNNCIRCAQDLITTHEQTRAGFIEAALEKNRKALPYIEDAKTLKFYASRAKTPMDFLLPAGRGFVDELIYRYLLIRGDSLGGSMRNLVGTIAEIKLKRKIFSVLSMLQISFNILSKRNKNSNRWTGLTYEDAFSIADEICAISWSVNEIDKVLFFNTTIPLVRNNVDICLYKGTPTTFDSGKIVHSDEDAIMFGELKGGIDPAGADEHWKTGNTALARIRTAFKEYNIKTSFVGAAIEKKMAEEIFLQLESGTLSNAANLTYNEHLTNYCEWLVKLQ